MRALVLRGPSAVASGSLRRRPTAEPVLTLDELAEPIPHAPGWVVVAPSLSGLSEADLRAVRGTVGAVERATRGPAQGIVPGGEVVGVVTAVAPGTRGVTEGMRVVIDPLLTCFHKALPSCARCRCGEAHLCENADRPGRMVSGARVGLSATTGGGWSDGVMVHDSMLVEQGSVSDQRAVLAVPAAVALHSARAWTGRGDRVGVVGTGVSALLLIASLRRLYPTVEIVNVDPTADDEPNVAADVRARRMGAATVRRGTDERLLEEIAADMSSRLLRTGTCTLPMLDGGLDAVFDTTDHAAALSLRLVRSAGTLVTCGDLQTAPVDWPLVVRREISVHGRSVHAAGPDGRPALAAVLDWLGDDTFPVDGLVSHRFPMEQHQEAIGVAVNCHDNGACRVVFVGPAATTPSASAQDRRGDATSELTIGLLGRLRGMPARVSAGSR